MGKYKVRKHAIYNYFHLDPVPSKDELEEFYRDKYYALIQQGGRFPEAKRMKEGGKKAERELQWMHETFYSDIVSMITMHSKGDHVFDIGCGRGELLLFLHSHGLKVSGMEPSLEAAEAARAKGLEVFSDSLSGVSQKIGENKFDAITLLNVLEHVPDPVELIMTAKSMLSSEGIMIIKVPNDFTELQQAAQKHLDCREWWLAIPDHVNYFNFITLSELLQSLGFSIVYEISGYPMEIFLMMGENYVDNPSIGEQCHNKRVEFELAIGSDTRRKLYEALAKQNMGRNCTIVARKSVS